MKITQIVATTPGQFDNKSGNTQSTTSYKLGQVLDARVLANSSQGQVGLRLGGADVLASTKIPLQQNAALSVKVIQLQPQLLLQVLTAPAYNPLQDAKLNLLPKQAALAPLLAELIHKTTTLQAATSQSALKSAGEVLMAALFGRNELKKPEGLQTAIKQSGLFLEAKLAAQTGQNPAVLSKDLKAVLLRYLDTLAKTKQESSVAGQSRLSAQISLPSDDSLPPLKGKLPISHVTVKIQQGMNNVPDKFASETLLKKPEGLQTAIKQSGLFLEAKLAAQTGQNPTAQTGHIPRVLSKDAKAVLLHNLDTLAKTKQEPSVAGQSRLSAQISLPGDDSLPPLKGKLPISHVAAKFQQAMDNVPDKYASEILLKKLEGAVARLGLLQVATADNFDEGTRLWQLEIPLKHEERVETVSLTIEKEQKDSDEDEEDSEDWAVNLSLDLPQLGALQSRINKDALGISTTFWSDSTKTITLLESRLSELRANLERSGLQAHQLNCRKGAQPKTPTQGTDDPPDSPLVDLQI